MKRIIVTMSALLIALTWMVGCTRAPQEAATSSKIPEALVKAAGGKAAFIEFYAPN